MMPQLSGMDLHAHLVGFAPDQAERMVFITGGAFTLAAREFLNRVPNERFDKPFDASRLRMLAKMMVDHDMEMAAREKTLRDAGHKVDRRGASYR